MELETRILFAHLVEPRGPIELAGPFVPTVEFNRPDGHTGQPKPVAIRGELFCRVQLVAEPAPEQHLGNPRQRGRVELGSDVGAQRENAAHATARRRCGAEGHRNALRESGKHDMRAGRPFLGDRIDDGGNVTVIVGDRELAILSRHPARHHLVASAAVEPVQALN